MSQEVNPKGDAGTEVGCAAEVLIVADEMRSWMRSETVEAHARRKDATEGNSECAKPQKLRDYLASTPAAAKPSPRTMEDVEKELAQQQAPAPSPAANAAPAPAPKRAWGGQRHTDAWLARPVDKQHAAVERCQAGPG